MGLVRHFAALAYWSLHSWCWVRWHGARFRCRACRHRFWAVPAQHGFKNSCPRCYGVADRV